MEEINKPNLDGFDKNETKSYSISSRKVDADNPELIVGQKSRKLLITILSLLLALIIVTTVIVVILPSASSPTEIKIELSVEFELTPIDIVGEIPPGTTIKLMPGDSLNAKYSVKSTDEEGSTDEVFIRIKVYATSGGNYYDNLFVFDNTTEEWRENWMIAADGYIYLRKTLKANEQIDFMSKLTLNKNIDNTMQEKTIHVHFLAEALQAGEGGKQAIASIWETSPQVWRDEVLASQQV